MISALVTVLSSVLGAAVSSTIMGLIVLYPDQIRYKIRVFNRWRWKRLLSDKQYLLDKEIRELRWSINPYSAGSRIGSLMREIKDLEAKIEKYGSIVASDGTKTVFIKH